MACSGKAPMVTSAAAMSRAILTSIAWLLFTAPTVGLTLAMASLAKRMRDKGTSGVSASPMSRSSGRWKA